MAGTASAGAAATLRAWAVERPNEFQLIYGTPIPGYVAPAETIPQAARVATPFLAAACVGAADSADATPLVAALAELIGILTLEFGGHFHGVTNPASLYSFAVANQVGRLGLD